MQQIAIEGTAIAIDNKLVPKNEWNDRILTDENKITLSGLHSEDNEPISRNEIYRHYRGTPHRTGKPLNHRPARQRIGFNPPPQTEVFRRKNRATVTLDSPHDRIVLHDHFELSGKIPACRCYLNGRNPHYRPLSNDYIPPYPALAIPSRN